MPISRCPDHRVQATTLRRRLAVSHVQTSRGTKEHPIRGNLGQQNNQVTKGPGTDSGMTSPSWGAGATGEDRSRRSPIHVVPNLLEQAREALQGESTEAKWHSRRSFSAEFRLRRAQPGHRGRGILLAVEHRDDGIIGPRISPSNRCSDSAPWTLSPTDERYRQGPDRRQQWTNTVPSTFDERGLVEVVSTEARVSRAWERP